jgi:hypothetical protein
VQFKVDEVTTGATDLIIQGEAVNNAATFTSSTHNVSARRRTTVEVRWVPPVWTRVSDAGVAQRTPDIAPVIQEIVNRLGWKAGNALVLIITGSGTRTAESYEGDRSGAPLLHVEYR